MVQVRRVYEGPSPGDGYRVLVDRLWPRGVRKEDLAADAWLKDIAPSTELRQAYHAGALTYPTFRVRYLSELQSEEASRLLQGLASRASGGTVTLLTASRSESNHATVLAEVLGGAPLRNPDPSPE